MSLLYKIELFRDAQAKAEPSLDLRFRAAFGNRGSVVPDSVETEYDGTKIFEYSVREGDKEKTYVCSQGRDGSTTILGTNERGAPEVTLVNRTKDGGFEVISGGEKIEFDSSGKPKPKKKTRHARKHSRRSLPFRNIKPPKVRIPKFLGKKDLEIPKLKIKNPEENPAALVKAGLSVVVSETKGASVDLAGSIDAGVKLALFSVKDAGFGAVNESAIPESKAAQREQSAADGSAGASGSVGAQYDSAQVFLGQNNQTKIDEARRGFEREDHSLRPYSSDGAILMVSGSEDVKASNASLHVEAVENCDAQGISDNSDSTSLGAFADRDVLSSHEHRSGIKAEGGMVFGLKDDKHSAGEDSPIEAAMKAMDKVVMANTQGMVFAAVSKTKSDNRYSINAPSDSEQTGDHPDRDGQDDRHQDDGQSEDQYYS